MALRPRIKSILDVFEKTKHINKVKDIDSLLDLLLLGARTLTGADAGSIYLVKGDKLSFEYVHNDTLMAKDKSSKKYLYTKQEVEINNESIAGFAALNKQILNIEDVYKLKDRVPYSFNRHFDDSSSYHTQSVLTIPMIDQDKTVGVMQVINAKNVSGDIMPFSKEDELLVKMLADQASTSVERAKMTREVILRMVKMAELRDPEETGAHVNRVGTYAIEIYQYLAYKNHTPEKEIKRIKDILRLAAMLHDVGKVGINDAILKKTSRLDDNEYDEIKRHTLYGAWLFQNSESRSDWDDMAAEIALNHHERWDGAGYPGHVKQVSKYEPFSAGKKGDEIPLTARIVALADVYDALISRRSYKESWPEDKVLEHIRGEKHKHFDPEVVDAFIDIYDVIKAIREKYPDKRQLGPSIWTESITHW
ncbi:MAG: HD domain-containing protein [Candidatus Aminicenantes bacterium]|nr:HD domain-containing protein [Candidatus Aminicenantes bacterium]